MKGIRTRGKPKRTCSRFVGTPTRLQMYLAHHSMM
jgi:hypothetical protein